MRFFVLVLTLCVLPAAAFAQGTPIDRTITLDEALRIGLEQNLALQRQENGVRQQRATLSAQRNNFLPTFGVNAGTSQSYGRSVEETRLVNQTSESFNVGVGANVNVFNGFADVARVEQARAALEASRLLRDRSEQTVVFNVATGFLTVLANREQVRVLEQTLAEQRAQLARIETLIGAGSRPESERYQQQALVAQAELNVLNAQRDAEVAEAQLIQILQLDPFGQYRFVIPDLPALDNADVQVEAYDIATLLRQALQDRPDLAAQRASIRAAEEGIRVARSTRLPRVGFSANYGTAWSSAFQAPQFDANGNVVGVRTTPLFDQFDQRRGGSVSFSISLPIFDAFSTRSNTQRARLQVENEELGLADLRQNVATQVRQAYLDYLSFEKQVEVTAVQVESARRALDAAQQRYDAGAGTLLEVTQAQTSLTQAQSSQLRAQYSFFFQEKLIEYYLGVLDPASAAFN